MGIRSPSEWKKEGRQPVNTNYGMKTGHSFIHYSRGILVQHKAGSRMHCDSSVGSCIYLVIYLDLSTALSGKPGSKHCTTGVSPPQFTCWGNQEWWASGPIDTSFCVELCHLGVESGKHHRTRHTIKIWFPGFLKEVSNRRGRHMGTNSPQMDLTQCLKLP